MKHQRDERKPKIVVFTGAGISAESGIQTFRDSNGLWHEHRIEDVATPEGFAADPALVLEFYNQRRQNVLNARPNAAHLALARLEACFEVVIVTQNIDDLHERAGSSQVIHLHGEILKGQSSADADLVVPLRRPTIELGEAAPDGSQLRPHVVWFGEQVLHLDAAAHHFTQAHKVLTIGTSLSVFPAAALVEYSPIEAEKLLIAFEVQRVPAEFQYLQGKATELVPPIVSHWMEGCA